MPNQEQIRELAVELARENMEAEPSIKEAYWIPADDEIRLIEVDELTVRSDCVTPFYFRSEPLDGIPIPCGIALIRPEEVKVLPMPEGWGSWENAKKLAI